MLKLNYFESYEEVLQYELPEDILVICPSPKITDAFRQATNYRYEVITIAKWVKEASSEKKRVGKSELMLRFSSAWRHYFPMASENLFYNSFELFTELRSFSLDLEIIQNIIEPLDEEIQKSIKIYWAVLDAEDLIDEHLAYELKKNSKVVQRPLMFFGFKFLSSVQIDLVKYVSREVDVLLFFPSPIKEKSINTDWINWLDTSDCIKSKTHKTPKLNAIEFPKGKINIYLNQFMAKNQIDSICLLGGNNYLQTQEVAVNDFSFKDAVNIFNLEFIELFELIETESFVSIEMLLTYLQKELASAVENQNFKKVKVIQLLNESIQVYQSYTNVLDSFSLNVLKQVVELNLPRNFAIPVVNGDIAKLISLDDLKFIEKGQRVVVVLSRDMSPFSRVESSYNELIIDRLKSIGPIMRGSFDVMLNMFELEHVFREHDVIFFLEEGMLESDAVVRDLFTKFEVEWASFFPDMLIKQVNDLYREDIKNAELKDIKNFSSSKLQVYYDCPRKYFVNYIKKLDLRPEVRSGLGADDKGVLEHLIIGSYFENNTTFILDKLETLCRKEIVSYCANKQYRLSKKHFNEALYELIEYTTNALLFLYHIVETKPRAEIKFEIPIPQNKFSIIGSIDCVIREENVVSVIDFKRSSASIGSKQDLLQFNKLQLWVYGLMLSEHYKVEKIGYLNVSEVDDFMDVEFEEKKDTFELKLSEIIQKMKQDRTFLASPREKNVCEFCPISSTCNKGYMNE